MNTEMLKCDGTQYFMKYDQHYVVMSCYYGDKLIMEWHT